MKFTIKTFLNGKLIHKSTTHKSRRFLIILNSINFENSNVLAYLKVSYGKIIYKNKLIEEYNDGYYSNRYDLLSTFKIFCEKE